MKILSTLALATPFLLSSVAAVDLRREIYTLNAFCTAWNNECIAQAHRAGKAYSVCEPGYDGNGTASASCAAVVDTNVTDYTSQIAAALNATFV